jgi:hypothetical protein
MTRKERRALERERNAPPRPPQAERAGETIELLSSPPDAGLYPAFERDMRAKLAEAFGGGLAVIRRTYNEHGELVSGS